MDRVNLIVVHLSCLTKLAFSAWSRDRDQFELAPAIAAANC